jgi:acrylyl-CoA reductase (NADPH)
MARDDTFRALVLTKSDEKITAAPQTIGREQLTEQRPDGDVLVSVRYSSLNYKDALAVTGEGKVVRGSYPFVPGIDLVGTVISSESRDFRQGDVVLQTGWNLGEKYWGGFSQQQLLSSDDLIHLPGGLSMRDSMIVGTAGFTAMIAVMALEANDVSSGGNEVIVTGASGGVGSFAVAILADLGFSVTASTGSPETHDYLRSLGASRMIDREALSRGPERLLESERWIGAVDTVGGKTLAAILSQLKHHGSVASCGNAGGVRVETNVFPFILRGVNWLGIDSNTYPNDRRKQAWRRIARMFSRDKLQRILHSEIAIDDVPAVSRTILDEGVRGRVVVRLW